MTIADLVPTIDTKIDTLPDHPDDSAPHDHQKDREADHARRGPPLHHDEAPPQVHDPHTRNGDILRQPVRDDLLAQGTQHTLEVKDMHATKASQSIAIPLPLLNFSGHHSPPHQPQNQSQRGIARCQPDNDLPEHWDTTDTLYDQHQYGGLQMPRTVPATASARKNGTSGMDPLDIKIWQVAFEGKHNYMLRQLANGRWTQFQGHKSLPDAIFHMKLSTFIRNRGIRVEAIAVNYWKWKNSTEMLPSEAQRKEALELLVNNIGDLMRYNNPPAVQPQVRAQLAEKEAEIANLRAQLASQSRKTPFPQGIIPPTQTQMSQFFETTQSHTQHPMAQPWTQDTPSVTGMAHHPQPIPVSSTHPLVHGPPTQAMPPPPSPAQHQTQMDADLEDTHLGGIDTPSYHPSPVSEAPTPKPAPAPQPFDSPDTRKNKALLDLVKTFDDDELIQYISDIAPKAEKSENIKMDKIKQVHELTSSLTRYAAPSATSWINTLKMSGPRLQAQKDIATRLTVFAEANPKSDAYQAMVKAWSLPKLSNTAGTAAVATVVAGLAAYLH